MVHVHDTIVIGAGPGGSATAHFLSARGLDVLLLDRADFPRDKTCGDGLTPRALRALDRMGLLAEVDAEGCAIEGYEVVAPNGRSTTARVSGALVIPRLRLDDLVLRRAIASGADFRPKVTVTHVEPTDTGVRVHAANTVFDARIAVVATTPNLRSRARAEPDPAEIAPRSGGR